jgi:hypothetical protein
MLLVMSNLLYIISMIIAIAWCIGYFLWDGPAAIHLLIVTSFFGILASILLDNQPKAIKTIK